MTEDEEDIDVWRCEQWYSWSLNIVEHCRHQRCDYVFAKHC